MKRTIGLLAIILGTLGGLILIAGAVVVWRVEWEVVNRTDRVTLPLSKHLAWIDEKLHRLEGKLQNLTLDVGKLNADTAQLAEHALQKTLDQPEFGQLRDRLSGLLDRCEEFSETLLLIGNLFDDIANLSTQFGGNENIAEKFHEISTEIDQAATSLAGIRTKLSDLHLPEMTSNPQILTDLIPRINGPLERLDNAIKSISEQAVKAKEALEQVRGKVRFWMRCAAVSLCLFAAVYCWGQVCLIGWGWNRFRFAPSCPVAHEFPM